MSILTMSTAQEELQSKEFYLLFKKHFECHWMSFIEP